MEVPISAKSGKHKQAPTQKGAWDATLKKAVNVTEAIAKAEKTWAKKQKPKYTTVVQAPGEKKVAKPKRK